MGKMLGVIVVPVLNPLFLGIAANLEESVKIGVGWGYFCM